MVELVAGKPVEIILPVFNALPQLELCLASLQRTVAADQPILIINDCSTESGIKDCIAVFQRNRPAVSVIQHSKNLGFVRTVNEGFEKTDGDVVILNSDTITTKGWLQRLSECAQSDPLIATATPFSNNAEICSLPRFCVNNPIPNDPDQVAGLIANTGSPDYPELPTGVGFCMLISRRALSECGSFDAETFGHGYGEENDFCMRVKKAGMRNVLCDNAYVIHSGGASFSYTDYRPGGEQMVKLLQKHPEYEALVHQFIQQDPIKQRRELLVKSLAGLVHHT